MTKPNDLIVTILTLSSIITGQEETLKVAGKACDGYERALLAMRTRILEQCQDMKDNMLISRELKEYLITQGREKYLFGDNKMEVVAEIQEITGWSLPWTTGFCDHFLWSKPFPQEESCFTRTMAHEICVNAQLHTDPANTKLGEEQEQRGKVATIKRVREVTTWGLKRAKDFVDDFCFGKLDINGEVNFAVTAKDGGSLSSRQKAYNFCEFFFGPFGTGISSQPKKKEQAVETISHDRYQEHSINKEDLDGAQFVHDFLSDRLDKHGELKAQE